MVQHGETLGAKSVAAVDQDSRNLFTHIELFAAIVAKVKASCFVVSLKEVFGLLAFFLIFKSLLMGSSFFFEAFDLLAAIIEWLTLESICPISCVLLHFFKNL